jgi:hypothetical protein
MGDTYEDDFAGIFHFAAVTIWIAIVTILMLATGKF